MSNLIPNNNNLNRLVAFCPTLDPNWRKQQRIQTNPNQVETIEVIQTLQDEGWRIKGSHQERNKGVFNSLIKMEHQDLKLGNGDGFLTLSLNSLLNRNYDIKTQLGMFRLVCSNGLITEDNVYSFNINNNIEGLLNALNIQVPVFGEEINHMSSFVINSQQQNRFAKKAYEVRFGSNKIFNFEDLLRVNRKEDEGNQIWKVFNRVQENVTKPNMLVDYKGRLLGGVNHPLLNEKVNRELFKEAVKLTI